MSEIIASVSGVRGIIGDSFTPENIIKYTSAFAVYCSRNSKSRRVVVGRDGRMFGDNVEKIVLSTLAMNGFQVVNIGIAPTPTVQLATENLKSAGGISITASHNPQQWNGLKFLNPDGTFLDEVQVGEFLEIVNEENFSYADILNLKQPVTDSSWIDRHISETLKLKILNLSKIRKRKFRIVVDAVNSSGSVIVPKLLKKLSCKVIELYCDGSGKFPHIPEPLPGNLKQLCAAVRKYKADIGIAVDPDADRLVLITEKGEPFGEENTITAVTNFVLKNTKSKVKSATVNLSTTRAVDDVARKNGADVFRSPVGEINVVKEMIKNKSVIGGEGSGGVIYPELHYGRDSIAGIVLMLNEIADSGLKLSEYKRQLPQYFITKTKIDNVNNALEIFEKIKNRFENAHGVLRVWTNDGLKIEFDKSWVQMRKSNTEPIVRIITEADTAESSNRLNEEFSALVKSMVSM